MIFILMFVGRLTLLAFSIAYALSISFSLVEMYFIWKECRGEAERSDHGTEELLRPAIEFLVRRNLFFLGCIFFIIVYCPFLILISTFRALKCCMSWEKKAIEMFVDQFRNGVEKILQFMKAGVASHKTAAAVKKAKLRIAEDTDVLHALKKRRANLERELYSLKERIVEAEARDEIIPDAHPLRAARQKS